MTAQPASRAPPSDRRTFYDRRNFGLPPKAAPEPLNGFEKACGAFTVAVILALIGWLVWRAA